MRSQALSSIHAHRLEIVPASWRDLNAVHSLEKVCFPEDSWPLLDIVAVLTLPNVLRLKAVMEGRLVGFVAVDVRRREREAWIATIGVLPDFRRRGVAMALLEACEALLDVPRIRLSVRASNHAAQNLYRRLGYLPLGRWPGYYRGEDAIVMGKEMDR